MIDVARGTARRLAPAPAPAPALALLHVAVWVRLVAMARLVVLLIAMCGVLSAAQVSPLPGPAAAALGKGPVHVTARGPADPVPAGGAFTVTLDVVVDAGWHIYAHDSEGTGIRVDVSGKTADGLTFERGGYPAQSRSVFVPELDETYRALEGRFEIRAQFRVDATRAPGPATATVTLESQACTDTSCLNAETKSFSVPVTVRAAQPGEIVGGVMVAGDVGAGGTAGAFEPPGAAPMPASAGGVQESRSTEATTSGGGRDGADAGATLEGDFKQALAAGNVGSFLWLAVLLAFVSLLTPCVFPMIPITVSFFSKRGGEESRGRSVKYALAYGLGIVVTYTGFGLAMALLLGASSLQTFAAHPWTNLAIGALFVFFGLSLMGFYDLRPPAFLARRAEAGMSAGGSGYLPVIAMGFVFTVTAFTCTAPIVGSLLPALSTSGSPWLIVVGMLAYSAAFALPFVLLAMFPGMVSRLPGAGGWMVTLKVALGFIELIAALKFFSNADLTWDLQLMPRPVMLVLSILIGAALALYLLGTFALPHDVPGRRRALSLRTLAAIGAVLLVLYLARGLTGHELDAWTESYLPPQDYGVPAGLAAGTDAVPWIEDYAVARELARTRGSNLFIDFTGVTCVNCRIVEKSVFGKPGFAELMRTVVPVKLFTDRRGGHTESDAANQRLAESLGSVTLPLYVLMAPDGRLLRSMGYTPGLSLADFVQFVQGKIP